VPNAMKILLLMQIFLVFFLLACARPFALKN
jgi:hypothetical protein